MMHQVRYYLARCGSTYRITTYWGEVEHFSRVLQARRSIYAATFSPEYPTHSAEVERLIATGFLVEITSGIS